MRYAPRTCEIRLLDAVLDQPGQTTAELAFARAEDERNTYALADAMRTRGQLVSERDHPTVAWSIAPDSRCWPIPHHHNCRSGRGYTGGPVRGVCHAG